MNLTDFHAKYLAHELTRRFASDNSGEACVSSLGRTGQSEPSSGRSCSFRLSEPLLQKVLFSLMRWGSERPLRLAC